MTKRRKKLPNLMRAHPSFIALVADYAADWKARTGFDYSQTKVTEILSHHLTTNPPALLVGHIAPMAPTSQEEPKP